MLVFLDANIVIHTVEQPPDLGPRALEHVRRLLADGHDLLVSQLVRMECLVQPFTTGDGGLLAEYDGFFGSELVAVADITGPICERAARLRALHKLQALDALHFATAIEEGCAAFLTNDARLPLVEGIRLLMLGEGGQ